MTSVYLLLDFLRNLRENKVKKSKENAITPKLMLIILAFCMGFVQKL